MINFQLCGPRQLFLDIGQVDFVIEQVKLRITCPGAGNTKTLMSRPAVVSSLGNPSLSKRSGPRLQVNQCSGFARPGLDRYRLKLSCPCRVTLKISIHFPKI